MKGIVFTEFMDMVEDVFSVDILEGIIDKSGEESWSTSS